MEIKSWMTHLESRILYGLSVFVGAVVVFNLARLFVRVKYGIDI